MAAVRRRLLGRRSWPARCCFCPIGCRCTCRCRCWRFCWATASPSDSRPLAHFWLGAALMLAPVAAWIAIRGEQVVRPSGRSAAGRGAGRRGAAVGRRLRHHLRLPGRRLRPPGRPAQRAGAAGRGRGRLRLAAVCHLGMVVLLAVLPLVYPLLGLDLLARRGGRGACCWPTSIGSCGPTT